MTKYDTSEKVIISSEYYNALYQDGILTHQAEHDYLDPETLINLFPDASLYGADSVIYDTVIEGEGFPMRLDEFPLDLCEKYR